MVEFIIGTQDIDVSTLCQFMAQANNPQIKPSLKLSAEAIKQVTEARNFVDSLVQKGKRVYGINTGIGDLNKILIPQDKLKELQHNIILSHCCGVGPDLSRDIVMGMWVILLHSIAKGHCGVSLETTNHIIKILNTGLLPCVPSKGSVGASGDLAPSAHAALMLFGDGECTIPEDGAFRRIPTMEAYKRFGLKPKRLRPKEGVSLINGTRTTAALAAKVVFETGRLLDSANLATAMSIAGFRCSHSIVAPCLMEVHRHPGTLHCGGKIAAWLNDVDQQKHTIYKRLQDPYSIRCAPQVHGAVWEDFNQGISVVNDELNASTDNPLVFVEQEKVLHGGNFHAIYPSRVCDRLASALTTLGSISERRINMAMCSHKTGLPRFLIKDGGLNSGFMMAQVTAAALVSECKSLSFPASVDSIPTNCDQEDHVSMGPIAALKALQIAENVRTIIAIELMVAAQAIDLLPKKNLPPKIQSVHRAIRKAVPFLERDRVLSNDIKVISRLIEQEAMLNQ